MKTKIFYKRVKMGHAFYLKHEGKEYYLFLQNFRRSNEVYFKNGIYVDGVFDYSNAHSTSVRNTLEKLKVYISYIEKEYGIIVLEKSEKRKKLKTKPYSRIEFKKSFYASNDYEWITA